MRRNRLIISTTSVLAIICILLVTGFFTQAQATKHSDFGCYYCHVPHSAAGDNTQVPLWQPLSTETDLTGNYTNTHTTFQAETSDPDGASKLCLSCHDGTMFMSDDHVFGGEEGNEMGTLTHSHPISFVYDQTLADNDGELVDPGTLDPDVLDGLSKMQCSSCHDIHQTAVGNDAYLRWNDYKDSETAGSSAEFCRNCHALK